jgi:hypothetical protein
MLLGTIGFLYNNAIVLLGKTFLISALDAVRPGEVRLSAATPAARN